MVTMLCMMPQRKLSRREVSQTHVRAMEGRLRLQSVHRGEKAKKRAAPRAKRGIARTDVGLVPHRHKSKPTRGSGPSRRACIQTRSNKHNKHGAFHHALLSGMSFGMIDPKTWVNLSSEEAATRL